MMFELSREANEDLTNIWFYTLETWSVEQADRYVNLIIDEIEYLAINPQAGKNANHIRKDYLSSKIKSHVIFYRVLKRKNVIQVIRILHQRMDIINKLNE